LTTAPNGGKDAFVAKIKDGSFPRGSIHITILPPEAVTDGAQWRRVGTTAWLNGGSTESEVGEGYHLVEFKELPTWVKPADLLVNVSEGKTTNATVTYYPGGSLCVNIAPPEAATDGARGGGREP